jgi:Domain of unknown function (DUF6915)
VKPYLHAQASVRRYGGKVEDYLPIHDFMDLSKSAVADVRHRAVFHSAFGVFIVERVFGAVLTNSDDKAVCVRDVAEQHVLEDLGEIPPLSKWLEAMPIEPWMAGVTRARMEIVD